MLDATVFDTLDIIDDILEDIALVALDIASMLIEAMLDATVLDALDIASIFILLLLIDMLFIVRP